MSGGLDWSKAAVRTTHPQGAGELPGPFAALAQRGRGVSQQTQAPDLWASVRDNPSLPQVRSGGAPAPMEVEPWGCGGGCGSRVSTAQPRSSGPPQHEANAVPWPFAALAERGQKAATKAEPYDLWAPLRQGGQASRESCGCQDKAPARRAQQQTSGQTVKIVSGDWLAEVMRFDAETTRQIAGQEVHLDAEAWGAVRSAQRARMAIRMAQLRVARRRLETWRDETALAAGARGAGAPGRAGDSQSKRRRLDGFGSHDLPDLDRTEGEPDCGCQRVVFWPYGPRYVDSVEGDDDVNSGGLAIHFEDGVTLVRVEPWQTLRKVENWLQARADAANAAEACMEGLEVYLRTGRTWNGTEEMNPDGSVRAPVAFDYLDWTSAGTRPILQVTGLKATEASPLILSVYSVGLTLEHTGESEETEVDEYTSLGDEAVGVSPLTTPADQEMTSNALLTRHIGHASL